ncbi:FlaD/FlaE family flagellar protein [Halobellus captivus]|uniref:FlaD/FlaE family flagellar protein n=1 Tax=Halobellus captivus TaxID=2592614 RepID=UPI0011A272CE|nr:FlaD/FlaE family flagellar protein [Halobellus captivus]
MTLDPDDYDLRERRRIADERQTGRTDDPQDSREEDRGSRRSRRDEDPVANATATDSRDGPDSGVESGSSRETARRNGHRRRTDREISRPNGNDGRRNGGSPHRKRDDARAQRGGSDDRNDRRERVQRRRDGRDDDVSVRPREAVNPPRRGDSRHARAHDEVVLADQLARDLGFGERPRPRRRNGVTEAARGSQSRSEPVRDRTARSDIRASERHARDSVVGFDATDDVGRFQFNTELRERPRGRADEMLREEQLEQLLIHETAATDGGLTKPYLSSVPDVYVAERLVFDWLEFLVLNGGYKRTMDALRYYHTVEWLTEEVEAELQDYLVGFSGEVSSTREYDVDDHHLSLVYIARLASMT